MTRSLGGGEHLLLDPKIEDMMSGIAQALGDFWTRMPLSDFECLPAQAGTPSRDWVQLGKVPGFYVSGRKVRACPELAIAQQILRTVACIGGEADLFRLHRCPNTPACLIKVHCVRTVERPPESRVFER